MNVALAFNVKKESTIEVESASSPSSPVPPSPNEISPQIEVDSEKKVIDKFAEWDTQETIDAVARALSLYHDVTLVEADENAYDKLRDGDFDIVFNIAEGMNGVSREAQVPAMLEFLGIPYTGSDPLTLAMCLDKSRTKEILSYHGIPTSKFVVANSFGEAAKASLRYPLFVKPLHEGSSKGIYNSSYVENPAALQREVERILNDYEQPALIEEYLPGREFTVALLGNGNELKVLPPVEIRFDSLPSEALPVYSYEAKWLWDTRESPIEVFKCPAPIDDSLSAKIEYVCRKTFEVLNCRDWSRIDLRLDGSGEPNVIEINPLPGILPDPEEHSCFPMASRAAGLDYDHMMNAVLDAALKRTGKL
ncbi:MAG TPA: ATP-grasp domain-containing protein [Candidatus Acidoferrales bacterium]|nr:ATP-grasp domain-containing protein [Candidatus Acidoferrales bacterium]